MKPGEHQDTRLFRLAILAILILIFITVATIKIWELRIAAERVGILHTLGSLRSAMGMKLSELVIHQGVRALGTLDNSNPMKLWIPPPSNYLGEFTSAEAPLAPGSWYFDTDERLLIYRVRFTSHFSSDNIQYPELARYRLQLSYRDRDGNQRFDPYIDDATGLSLQPVDNYLWLIDAK
jgi:hypothetical protein